MDLKNKIMLAGLGMTIIPTLIGLSEIGKTMRSNYTESTKNTPAYEIKFSDTIDVPLNRVVEVGKNLYANLTGGEE